MASATLEAQQREFMALILDEATPLPPGWDARRVAIYRNAYRARLVDALRDTYPRTARWVGDAAFRRAAAHHLITHPPRSWTLDAAGEGFPATLAALFARDPEVAELGWLEWAMHGCFVSRDAAPLSVADFAAATADFREGDWAAMRLRFLPGTQQAAITRRIDRLWRALGEGADADALVDIDVTASEGLACIVWRQGLTPACLTVKSLEGRALALMLDGACYGELCNALIDELGEQAAVSEAGAMLGRWLNHGMIAAVSRGHGA